MRETILCVTILLLTLGGICHSQGEASKQRMIGVFNVIKFANEACLANDGKNGTCYTQDECEENGGSPSGSCADGYGVCCAFIMGCGGEKSENCTYFESTKGFSGMCNARICKSSSSICQLRLDFTTFVLTGPSTLTLTQEKILNGALNNAAGIEITDMTRCNTDQFSVTSPGSMSSPVICGINTGAHMFVDASEACNILSFQIGPAVGSATREWAIKITQFACDYHNLAPDGCIQYFYGGTTGTVQTFNFEGGLHLANQNQNICVRREKNQCRICWAHTTGDFKVSGKVDASGYAGKSDLCCGYGVDGVKTEGGDCIVVPRASKKATLGAVVALNGDEFCGGILATATGTTAATVCSQSLPFHVRFLSDNYEFADEAKLSPNGFKLAYEQFTCA